MVVIITAWVTPGVHIRDFWSAIIVAIVIALLNIFFKPLLILFTIPLTVITLGLFLFIVNALVIWVAGKIVSGFHIEGFGWALLYSLFLSLISYFFETNNAQTFFN